MSSANYQRDGFELRREAIAPVAVRLALAWITSNRRRSDIPHTRDARQPRNDLPIKMRKLLNSDPGFWQDFVLRSSLLPLIRQELGDEFWLIRTATFMKYPGSSSSVGWHCDADLWGHGCEAGLTAWIPLTAVPRESGCLRFMPGSHRQPSGRLYWDLKHPYHKVMDVSQLGEPVEVPAEAGDCILMDKRTVHSSRANVSSDERIALVFAFARCRETDLNEPGARIVFGNDFTFRFAA